MLKYLNADAKIHNLKWNKKILQILKFEPQTNKSLPEASARGSIDHCEKNVWKKQVCDLCWKKNKEFAKVITVTFVLLEIKIGPF